MNIKSIRCGLPCCVPDEEQTTCSRNLRITSVVLGIIVLLIGVGMLSSVSPLGAPIGWTCASLGILAIAMGSCLRCFKIKDISNIPMQETTLETAETSIKRKINFGETFTSGKTSFIRVLDEIGRNWSLIESEADETCTIAALSTGIGNPAIKTWRASKKSKMSVRKIIAFKEHPHSFKFYKDTLLVSFENGGVYVTTVGYGNFPTVEDNSNYLQNHFEYRAQLLDINENFLAISTDECIFVVSKEEQVKYKLNETHQLILNGDYLIGFSNKEQTLKIWDLKNKKRYLEINESIGAIKKFGNGFIYTINSNDDDSTNYYTWYPNDDAALFRKSINSPIFATFDRYIAIVTHANQIEIYDDNFNSIRIIQLNDNVHISGIQFLSTHIACILEGEPSYILAFDPVFSKE